MDSATQVAQCPTCGTAIQIRDFDMQVPRLAFLVSALAVHIAVTDMMMQLDEYSPAREGWQERLDTLERELHREIEEISEFGSAFDEG